MIKNSVSLKFLVVFFLLAFAWFMFINSISSFGLSSEPNIAFFLEFCYYLSGGFIVKYICVDLMGFEKDGSGMLIIALVLWFVAFGIFAKIIEKLTNYFISKNLRCNEILYLFLLFLFIFFVISIIDMIIYIYFLKEENYFAYWDRLSFKKIIVFYIFSFIVVFLKFKFYKTLNSRI